MNRLDFIKDPTILCDAGTLLARVLDNIHTKADLLRWFGSGLKFPEYYGRNWDALDECLRDLSWINQKRVVIFHANLPLDDAADFRAYIKLVLDVIPGWENDSAHELFVVFDPRCKAEVDATKAQIESDKNI